MREIVSTLSRVKIDEFNHVFIVIGFNDYLMPIHEELNKQLDAFGRDLSVKGKVVSAFESATRQTYKEILEKNWDTDFRRTLEDENEPFMLVINVDFKEFNL